MNSYKELIEELKRNGLSNGGALGHHSGLCDEAADAIEQLVRERNFLKASLELERDMHELTKIERDEANIRAEHKCDTCKNNFKWEWRGVQK